MRSLAKIPLLLLFLLSTMLNAKAQISEAPSVLIVGGSASHNFDRWFNLKDSCTLSKADATVRYTDHPEHILDVLPDTNILYLSNNQPLNDPKLRAAIFDFVESGHDLLIGHAATWYNWSDWPEFNKKLVGGGSRGHREYGEFKVEVVQPDHPLMQNVPDIFSITDELYKFKHAGSGSGITVLAKGINPETDERIPVVWTVVYGKGKIACITLGHDGKAHDHPAYITILQNSIHWFSQD